MDRMGAGTRNSVTFAFWRNCQQPVQVDIKASITNYLEHIIFTTIRKWDTKVGEHACILIPA